ncbi:MAG TPA: hypothetical protein VK921_05280 [Anditalea sp.]|nr:hypothetical protein [Anditalea sp.]
MKNTFSFALFFYLILPLAIITACSSEEEPTPIYNNEIDSEDYIEGIYIIGYEEKEFPIHLRTSNPAIFTSHPTKRTFEISSTGQGNYTLSEGAYWVNYHYENEPGTVHTLPLLITKNKAYAKDVVSAIKKMKTEPDGYTLVLRHALSSIGVDRSSSNIANWWKSCDDKVARQMDELGIAQSKNIGRILKKLEIPVTSNTSSEFCRAVQTLEYMELDVPIIQDAKINHQNINPKSPIYDDVTEIIKNNAVPGGIQIIVGHYNMSLATSYNEFIMPLLMGDGWILKSSSSGDPTFVGAIPYFYWEVFDEI